MTSSISKFYRSPNTVLLLALLTFASCSKDSPVKPPDNPTPAYPPGNRLFTWRTDTVGWFPSTLGGLWAFSDSDAYLTGYIGEGKPPYGIRMALHWNGSAWDTAVHGSYADIKHYGNDAAGDDHYMVSVGYWAIGQEKAALAEFDNQRKQWTGYQFQTQGELHAVWTDKQGYFIAVGDNGMVYTKDGYGASWVYSKAPTNYHLYRVSGVSKSECYILGHLNTNGRTYPQVWRYQDGIWTKLLDDLDTTGMVLKIPNDENTVDDIAAIRFPATDSLKLYVIGWESCMFTAKGLSLSFLGTNLSSVGLPLRALGRTGLDINAFSPNDLWVFGTRYNFFHWNGTNFQRMLIPGVPADDVQFGDQRKMVKTSTGKVFLPTEVSSQVYVVAQGTP